MKRETLADYECIRVLGEGSMGTIVLARSIGNPERLVAIKRLHPAGSPELAERIRREAETLQALEHPHIVRILDVIDDRAGLALVLQYAPNQTLAERLSDSGTLSVPELVRVLVPLADALAYAHDRNVLHRDVKPSNILFTADDLPLLADFGIARWNHHPTMTGTGAALGSAAFFDPALGDGEQPSAHNDLYACGVIGYLCLTGQLPFRGSTPLATIRLADEGAHERLSTEQLGPIADVLERAFTRAPDDRWPDLRSFSAALKEIRLQPKSHDQTTDTSEWSRIVASPPPDLMPEPSGVDPFPTIQFQRGQRREAETLLPTTVPGQRRNRRKILLAGFGVVAIAGLAVSTQVRRSSDPSSLRPLPLPKLPACVPETTPQCVRSYSQTPFGMRVTFEDGSTGQYRAGIPGDVARVDNWFCGRRATLAVYRPSTGQVFVADRWPDPLDPSPLRVIRLDTRIANADVSSGPGDNDSCADLAFDSGTTRTWFYPNVQVAAAQPVQVVAEPVSDDTGAYFLFARIDANSSPVSTQSVATQSVATQSAEAVSGTASGPSVSDNELVFNAPGAEIDDAISPPPVEQLDGEDDANGSGLETVATLPPVVSTSAPGPTQGPTRGPTQGPAPARVPTQTPTPARAPTSAPTQNPTPSTTPVPPPTSPPSTSTPPASTPSTSTPMKAPPSTSPPSTVATKTAQPIPPRPKATKPKAKKSAASTAPARASSSAQIAPAPGFDGQKFTLGVIANTADPISGPTAKATLAGIKARIAMINSGGGIGGNYPVTLHVITTADNPNAVFSAWKANSTGVAAWISIGGRGTSDALEPALRADQSVASFTSFRATQSANQANVPASTATDFAIINALGYLTEQSKSAVQTTCILTSYGSRDSGSQDAINFAAARLSFPAGPVVTLPTTDAGSASTVATTAVQTLRSANCSVVVLDVLPSQTADVLLSSKQTGFAPRWIILSGSFRPDLLPSATGPTLEQSAVVVGDGTDWALPQAAENLELRKWLTDTGDASYLDLQAQGLHLGWQQAKAMHVLLEEAVRRKDVSHGSLYRVAADLRSGSVGTSTALVEIGPTRTNLYAVDFSSPGGVRVVAKNYLSPVTASFRDSLVLKTPQTTVVRRGGQVVE